MIGVAFHINQPLYSGHELKAVIALDLSVLSEMPFLLFLPQGNYWSSVLPFTFVA